MNETTNKIYTKTLDWVLKFELKNFEIWSSSIFPYSENQIRPRCIVSFTDTKHRVLKHLKSAAPPEELQEEPESEQKRQRTGRFSDI